MRPGPAVPGHNQHLLSVPSEAPVLLPGYSGGCLRPIQAEIWIAVIRVDVDEFIRSLIYFGIV